MKEVRPGIEPGPTVCKARQITIRPRMIDESRDKFDLSYSTWARQCGAPGSIVYVQVILCQINRLGAN